MMKVTCKTDESKEFYGEYQFFDMQKGMMVLELENGQWEWFHPDEYEFKSVIDMRSAV